MELMTKLEELILIAILRIMDKAYDISIYNCIIDLTGRDVAASRVYFPLERLVRKGYLQYKGIDSQSSAFYHSKCG